MMSPNGYGQGRLSELSEDECYRRLEDADVGRIGLCTEDGPMILPVNFVVDGRSIVVRTSPYTALAGHADGLVAFEVDLLEPALRFGWSVLVVGRSVRVDDVDVSTQLQSSRRLEAWASGPRNLFIRITPDRVTGREIG